MFAPGGLAPLPAQGKEAAKRGRGVQTAYRYVHANEVAPPHGGDSLATGGGAWLSCKQGSIPAAATGYTRARCAPR